MSVDLNFLYQEIDTLRRELEAAKEYGSDMANEVVSLKAQLEAARAEIERLLKESQDEMDFSFKILDSCSNQRDALKTDLAAAVDTIRRIATSYDVDAMAEARAFLKRMEVMP